MTASSPGWAAAVLMGAEPGAHVPCSAVTGCLASARASAARRSRDSIRLIVGFSNLSSPQDFDVFCAPYIRYIIQEAKKVGRDVAAASVGAVWCSCRLALQKELHYIIQEAKKVGGSRAAAAAAAASLCDVAAT